MGFSKKFAKEIFKRADGNKNGEIDQLEFLDAMLLFISDYDDINEAVSQEDDDDSDDNVVVIINDVVVDNDVDDDDLDLIAENTGICHSSSSLNG